MKHIYKQGSSQRTFLLLHGTGGDENGLLGLAEVIDPTANVLSVRGKVLENGMPRFFKRLSEGVFDREDLDFRTKELHQFLDKAAKQYEFDRAQITAIAYSNGANIAASLLFNYKDSLSQAILHHPMVPMRDVTIPDLSDVAVFIGAGRNDFMCPAEESIELESLLTEAQADVHIHWESNGHQLTQTEVEAARNWYQNKKTSK